MGVWVYSTKNNKISAWIELQRWLSVFNVVVTPLWKVIVLRKGNAMVCTRPTLVFVQIPVGWNDAHFLNE